MLKKLFAIVLCLMLTAGALAETVPGARLTADEFSIEMDGEILQPELSAVADIAQKDGSLLLDFRVNLNGKELLPLKMREFADGTAAVQLKDAGPFRFSSELLQRESGLTENEFALLQLLRDGGPAPLAFELVEMLDAREEDNFTLTPDDLPEWVHCAARMEANIFALFEEGLPDVSAIPVKRDSLGYTITVGKENPYYITLRRSGDQVIAKMQILGYNFQWIFSENGGVQLTHYFGVSWYDGDMMQNDLVFKYVPDEDGSAFLSLTDNYAGEWPTLKREGGKLWLNVTGKMSAEGVIDVEFAAARVYDDSSNMTVRFHVTSESAEMEASVGGESDEIMKKANSAYKMAEMKWEKDLKELRKEPGVAKMLDCMDFAGIR